MHFDGWERFWDSQPWPHKCADSPQKIHGARPISSRRYLPVCFFHSLWRLFLFPQECPEGWDSFGLIRESRQKKPSKGWMARSPAVLPNRLLWSLPTTQARSPARPYSPSSTSPPTGATLARFTTRPRGSGRHTRGGKNPTPRIQSGVGARETHIPERWGKCKNLHPQEPLCEAPYWTSVSTTVKWDGLTRCSSKPPFNLRPWLWLNFRFLD